MFPGQNETRAEHWNPTTIWLPLNVFKHWEYRQCCLDNVLCGQSYKRINQNGIIKMNSYLAIHSKNTKFIIITSQLSSVWNHHTCVGQWLSAGSVVCIDARVEKGHTLKEINNANRKKRILCLVEIPFVPKEKQHILINTLTTLPVNAPKTSNITILYMLPYLFSSVYFQYFDLHTIRENHGDKPESDRTLNTR